MRLHRLRISAFGPFAGTEDVDLDLLSGSGLFLLHGPTGAGKSSVLDAICFALYGRVPGARAGSALRSDHAPPDLRPEVICEFSVSGRRFEVTRSPSWERPKKRGHGTTTEQARVQVRHWRNDQWEPLTARLDEAAQLLDGVLGLGPDQFTKLVMLPQGEFAAFLRADAEDRRQLLERLFGTDRFAAVQHWLRDRQLAARHEVDVAAARTATLLARAEQAMAPLDGGAGAEPGAAGPPGADPPPGAAQVLADQARRARQLWEDAIARRTGTQAGLARAVTARQQAETLAAHQREQATAAARWDALQLGADEQQQRRDAIRSALRAAALAPLVPPLDEATRARDVAEQRVGQAWRAALACDAVHDAPAIDAEPDDVEPDDARLDHAELEARLERLREEIARLAAVEQDATVLAGLDASAAEHATAAAAAASDLAGARDEVDRLALELTELRRRQDDAGTLGADEGAAQAGLDEAKAVAQAVLDRDRLAVELSELRAVRTIAREHRDDARERWLDLRQQRLDGIAAELAAGLVDDTPCPVCGSAEHPAPAAGSGPVVDEATEHAARAEAETAQLALDRQERAVADLTARLDLVTTRAAGLDAVTVAVRLRDAAERLATAQRAGREATALAARHEQLAASRSEWTDRRDAAEQGLRTAEAELARALERAGGLRARVDEARGDAPSVGARKDAVQARARTLADLLGSRQELAAATALLARAAEAAEAASRQGGFPDLASALAAVLDPEQLEALEQRVAGYDADLAAVTDRLRSPELVAAAAQPPAQLTQLAQEEELARDADEASARTVTTAETAVKALDGITAAMAEHLRRTEPLQQRHARLQELSRCVDGTGGDNLLRMSLSAYVLAARLEQVAEAASLRLAAMSGGRYRLVHSDGLQRGRGRSGLSLRVVDGWTGQERDTASLSGGESFYTSLALALGLADVVTAEAGGTQVETLFVDEGFGTLDEESLDEVMDVLDDLRSGGRAVGLVSHVADLRDRIPARLEVIKTRNGSRLRQVAS